RGVIGKETGIENLAFLVLAECLPFRCCQQTEERVTEGPALELRGVVLDLFRQHGHEIHHRTHLWVAFQMVCHVAVVLERVQVNPGQDEFWRAGTAMVAVVRLVHVPQQYKIDSMHACLTYAWGSLAEHVLSDEHDALLA